MRQPAISGHATIEHSQRQRVPVRLLGRLRIVVRNGQAELRRGARTARGLPDAAHRSGRQQIGPAGRPSTRRRRGRLRMAVLRATQNEASSRPTFNPTIFVFSL